MSAKHVEKFVRSAIRSRNDPNERQLRALLADMETPDLQTFWHRFTADRAFGATAAVPEWKTREQNIVLRHALAEYWFYPTDKDSSGKWIVVRSELEDHIIRCLLRHIKAEQEAAQDFHSAAVRTPSRLAGYGHCVCSVARYSDSYLYCYPRRCVASRSVGHYNSPRRFRFCRRLGHLPTHGLSRAAHSAA
jgi:hypothetical protein